MLRKLFLLISMGALLVAVLVVAGYFYLSPRLPDTEVLRDVRLQEPLRVFTSDGKLIAEFGEKKRIPVRIEDTPQKMIQAVLAAEDDRFYEHPGVDYLGLMRAVWHLLRTGRKGPGGSTITMQVARNFLLTREKTFLRKFSEILLSLKIERELSKSEILELYLNKIYLGHRAYGVGAAAQVYYGKLLKDLNLSQMAIIAGLPKAPSTYNPIVNRKRAMIRRNYVLQRMRKLNFISQAEYDTVLVMEDNASWHKSAIDLEADHLAEQVRAEMVKRFGSQAYTEGFQVITTLDSKLQLAANYALKEALLQYDRRHGFRGPEKRLTVEELSDVSLMHKALGKVKSLAGLSVAAVTEVGDRQIQVYSRHEGEITLDWEGLSWAREYIDVNHMGPKPTSAEQIVSAGDVVRIYRKEGQWFLAQKPTAEGALVSLESKSGKIVAIRGGFDFQASKFNRVIQAKRQPGSNFKPFIYSAALDKGYTAASLINDAPVVFEDEALESTWRPENYSGRFFGPTRLRVALMKSRNLVSIRLLRAIGIRHAVKYSENFGFSPDQLSHDLSLALGSAPVMPLSLARGYAVFANGGYLIEPYFIQRILDRHGKSIFESNPVVICDDCKDEVEADLLLDNTDIDDIAVSEERDNTSLFNEVIPPRFAERTVTPQNVYLMKSMLQDVVQRGTGRRARVLKRQDLGGKTGTTNDQKDAWFSGFGGSLVTTTWVGFDRPSTLGQKETGGRAALPMWIAYMREALPHYPQLPVKQPDNMITIKIDPQTAKAVHSGHDGAIFETFRKQYAPAEPLESDYIGSEVEAENGRGLPDLQDQLF